MSREKEAKAISPSEYLNRLAYLLDSVRFFTCQLLDPQFYVKKDDSAQVALIRNCFYRKNIDLLSGFIDLIYQKRRHRSIEKMLFALNDKILHFYERNLDLQSFRMSIKLPTTIITAFDDIFFETYQRFVA